MKDAKSEHDKFLSDMLEKHANTIYRIAVVYLKNISDAEDVVQEVFLRLYQSNNQFDNDEHVRAWLIRVTCNYCKSLLRSPLRRRVSTANFIAVAEDHTDRSSLVEAVLALPRKYRDSIYLFYYEGYSTAEIAHILNQKEATVRTHLARGSALLKANLAGGVEYDT